MLTKYTNCEIIEVKSADEKIEGNAKMSSFDHIPRDTYRTNDGYIYVKVRAISSRVNKNFDGWPVNELAGMEEKDFRDVASKLSKVSDAGGINKLTFTGDSEEIRSKGDYGFRTFVGRPVFIDHNNSDPKEQEELLLMQCFTLKTLKKLHQIRIGQKRPRITLPKRGLNFCLKLMENLFPNWQKRFLPVR